MERTTLDSTHLRSVGYDAAQHVLEIEFQAGRVFQYFDVSEAEYNDLMAAGSHGQ